MTLTMINNPMTLSMRITSSWRSDEDSNLGGLAAAVLSRDAHLASLAPLHEGYSPSGECQRARQDSNLRSRCRRPELCPLSYERLRAARRSAA